jgi:hypothetical protein
VPRRRDPALVALDSLMRAVAATEKDLATIRDRAEFIYEQRAAGTAWADLVPAESAPLIVRLLTDVQDRLNTAGANWRRLEAQALHAEGLSMDRIAVLFGVTRQRVSSLLKNG